MRTASQSITDGVPTFQELPLEDVIGKVELNKRSRGLRRASRELRKAYAGRTLKDLDSDLEQLQPFFLGKTKLVNDEASRKILVDLGIVPCQTSASKRSTAAEAATKIKRSTIRKHVTRLRNAAGGTSTEDNSPMIAKVATLGHGKIAVLDQDLMQVATVENYPLVPLPIERPKVPTLSHDLSRVLFNPGVYQLQDPRSRVWNFDPYLGNIMPVSEFNYDALNKYVTSSEDSHLRDVALKHQKRYIGSTSSMSGILSHFHFLLSAWRELNMDHLTRGFKDEGKTFTRLQRGPTAIFLRYQDGVYAVDADKEFDSANILMSLGRSMEKLLTVEKDEFERYRRTHDATQDANIQSKKPEAYHYSGLGSFLLRAQLDAQDPRLPGTGMFDLKTRAVAAVRMMIMNHEVGAGYQIKERFGTWESYEREYHDMMRSAFLKYSLQVRMGRMDGIFVAYHNTERLFGFQYVPLSELDFALHGQTDRTLGDREFQLSFKLLNEVFDAATAKFPNRSLRFHFEARAATAASPPHMYIFAEPVSEEEILEVQTSKQKEIEAYEQRIFHPHRSPASENAGEDDAMTEEEQILAESALDPEKSTDLGRATSPSAHMSTRSDADVGPVRESNAADVAFLESLMGVDMRTSDKVNPTEEPDSQSLQKREPVQEKEILAWKLNVRNLVNELPIIRPQNLTANDTWKVEYTLTPLPEASGRRNYTLCKARRKANLEEPQEQDEAVGYYIKRLVSMSKDGAQWRKKWDELDAQNERIVLYGDGGA
ncbi:uncharacterized protein Z518_01680 [Rhinocladiella mackenziei CBS 650.93]|uniref:Mitochondrial mRNA processing protein PET127 n=1 Tax=Rhinocladiella mackenziei CBS 650.93 TaxID=1442369 RepID=A0A0D2J4H5_9EURO|nr:uncharacterized protein Z518_01680 [Rhinocladiella mackenziei CBS 650.93]KIX10596.1 hypothetical protein Z518_01680 [Rhinocladiella mackenziei CBS 650.93]